MSVEPKYLKDYWIPLEIRLVDNPGLGLKAQ